MAATQLEIPGLKKTDTQRYKKRTPLRIKNSRTIESFRSPGNNTGIKAKSWKMPKTLKKTMKTEQISPAGKPKELEAPACHTINATAPKSIMAQRT
jgi:hypothetical protein